MCTLSWVPRGDGYVVFFNRDERVTRAPALPPAVTERDGVPRLAPTDGDYGGTWIGVNRWGVTAAILNRYEDTPVGQPEGMVSRGLLVADALAARSAGELVERVAASPLTAYRPFTICALGLGTPLLVADWSGAALTRSEIAAPGLARTSSGRNQREAEQSRTAVWAAMRGDAEPTPALIGLFHRSHLPTRGPLSVCMHRPEANTQSLSVVEVGESHATFTYLPGPPCEDAPAHVSVLALAVAR